MRIEVRELEGRDHYVVPVVMAIEGVLNGSGGALFYPAAELQKTVHLWNGRPVVVYHPDMYVSGIAGNYRIFNQQKVGCLFNAEVEDKRLKAEAWLDPERLKKVDKRVLEAIQNQEMLEVSTGLFTDNDDVAGTFNGKNYVGIARNYHPDHLAILPDQKGACSIEGGCGLCRNEELVEGLCVPTMQF